MSSERRAQHFPLTAAAFSCCRHSCDPRLGGSPGGRSGHASGSSPQVKALPGALEALICSAKWLVEIKLHFISCAMDVGGTAIQQQSMPCVVTVGLQAEQGKLGSYYTEIEITACSLYIYKKYIRATHLILQNVSEKLGFA